MLVSQGFHEKKHLSVQKRPPKKIHFQKNFKFLVFFLSLEALSNSPKVQILQNRRKKLTEKCKKNYLFENLQKKSFFWKDFLEFLWFYLILGLSLHIHLFFQLSSCTGWSTIRDFRVCQKTAFFAFFCTSPLKLRCLFRLNQLSSPVPYSQ